MPIPAPGNVDMANQSTLLTVQAKTDLVFNDYVYLQLLSFRGRAVQGTWTRNNNPAATEWLSDRKLDTAGYFYNGLSAAMNDEYAYPVFLPAGTYSCEIYYGKDSASGIMTLLLGATVLGSFDAYAAGVAFNFVATISFVVAADTTANLRLLTATKNGASTAYYVMIQRVTLWRTA